MAIDDLLKNYREEVGIGVMHPLYYVDSNQRSYIQSSEFNAQYPLIGIRNICEPIDTLIQFHNNVSAVSDYPCCNIKETVSQSLDKSFLINARASLFIQLTILYASILIVRYAQLV